MSSDLFAAMRPVTPPPDLRDRALRAARGAAAPPESGARAGVGFTRFDLAWAAALLLLLAGNLLLSVRGRPDSVVTASAQSAAAAMRRDREDRRLARELGVSPSLIAAARPRTRPSAGEELSKLLDDPAFERL
jgi:hypothetical protein